VAIPQAIVMSGHLQAEAEFARRAIRDDQQPTNLRAMRGVRGNAIRKGELASCRLVADIRHRFGGAADDAGPWAERHMVTDHNIGGFQ
jgi:hypothetical protein